MATSPLSNHEVKINAEVLGLGPKFLLRISLQNTGKAAYFGSTLSFSFNPAYYCMGYSSDSLPSMPVPLLLPGPKQIFETEIKCIDVHGRADNVLVVVAPSEKVNTSVPLVSATIRMPNSEMWV